MSDWEEVLVKWGRRQAAPAIRERGDPEVLCYEIAKAVESFFEKFCNFCERAKTLAKLLWK
nr:MAG TPA: hypothetical protein [Caudoviricetes sp.]